MGGGMGGSPFGGGLGGGGSRGGANPFGAPGGFPMDTDDGYGSGRTSQERAVTEIGVLFGISPPTPR